MAWKIYNSLQAVGTPTHAAYPGGAYRIRLLFGQSVAPIESYLTTAIAAGRYVLPYIEMGYDADPDLVWKPAMENWAAAFENAGVEYVEFGNEIDHTPDPPRFTTYQQIWDAYLERARISAPIFRAHNVGMMMTCLGPSRYTPEWFNYIAANAGFKYFDTVAVHTYSGGTHQDGTAAGGQPADSLRRLTDARAALDSAGPGHPEVEMWQTEYGWPTHQPPVTTRVCNTQVAPNDPKVLTGVSNTGALNVGWIVHGPRIPKSTTIVSKTASTVTLSQNATAPAAIGVTISFGGGAIDPTHQTYSTPAQQATKIAEATQLFYDAAAANRCRMISLFTSRDYRTQSDPPVDPTQYTPGNWANHSGVDWESGSLRAIEEGTTSKPARAAVAAKGLGQGLSGVKPTCVRGTVSAITSTTATVAGTVDPNNLATSWRIEHGPDENFGKRTVSPATIAAGASPVAISKNLTALPPASTVHWRITAWNDAGFAWSDRGTLVTLGGGGATVYQTPTRQAGSGPLPITANELIPAVGQPALPAGTQIFHRLRAENSEGIDYGNSMSFTTLSAGPEIPTAVTGAATGIDQDSATLNGIVDPNGPGDVVIDWHFEYGLTTDYGTTVPVPEGSVIGSAPVSVSAEATGLLAGRLYHYQLFANDGAAVGGDRTFFATAPAAEPPEVFPPDVLPLALSVEIETADGRFFRWDHDDADPMNRPQNKRFGTQEGDGFGEASCVLHRPIGLDHADLALLDKTRWFGADGSVAYEGLVVGKPASVDEEGEWIEVNFAGLFSSARFQPFVEIYVDRSTDRWQPPGLGLRRALIVDNDPLDADYTVSVDTGIHFKGTTGKAIPAGSQAIVVYRAPRGTKISSFQYAGTLKNIGSIEAPRLWGNAGDTALIGNWSENLLLTLSAPGTDPLPVQPPANFVHADSPWRIIALRMACTTTHTPTAAQGAHRHYEMVAVYGDHGVPLHPNGDEPDGVWASEVFHDIIERFCPLLDASEIAETTVIIPHLVFDTPTDPWDALSRLNGFHAYLLAAWEGGKIQWEPPDRDDADWIIRSGEPGVNVQLHGSSTDDFFNGCVVSYRDAQERDQILWPEDYEELRDDDPNNPSNRAGYPKHTKLEISNSVNLNAALALGEAHLQDTNYPKAAGTVTISFGYIQSKFEHLEPGWKVRYGHTLSIANLPNDEPRLINSTSWDEEAKSLTINLEQPPSRVDAVLARLALKQSVAGIG